mmetsp:Transcript_29102/g.41664  ORF Transcript_29102/g.41664 Transcript_29102/m.41664 type:complete len:82 (+) Transcript_29102:321-566(+)
MPMLIQAKDISNFTDVGAKSRLLLPSLLPMDYGTTIISMTQQITAHGNAATMQCDRLSTVSPIMPFIIAIISGMAVLGNEL